MPDRNVKHTFLYSICWRGMNILKYQFTEGLVVNVTDKSQMNKLNTCQVAFWTIYSYEASKLGHRWIGYTPEKYGCNNLPMFIYQINYTSKKDPGYLDRIVWLLFISEIYSVPFCLLVTDEPQKVCNFRVGCCALKCPRVIRRLYYDTN